MGNIKDRDTAGYEVSRKADGSGTDVDPFIPHVTAAAGVGASAMKQRDTNGYEIYLRADGTGTDVDPYVPHVVLEGGGTGGGGTVTLPWIDPTAAPYNADPTGVADATTALQSALNALAAGGRLLLPPSAHFKISGTLSCQGKYVTIEGAGSTLDFYGTVPAGTAITVASGTPVVITAAGHGVAVGQQVFITGALGNTGLNGVWTASAVTASTITLQGSASSGGYTGGGVVTALTAVLDFGYAPGVDAGSVNYQWGVRSLKVRWRNQTGTGYGINPFIGLRVRNTVDAFYDDIAVVGFGIGLQVTGDGVGCQKNQFRIRTLQDNVINLHLYAQNSAGTNGYVTENSFWGNDYQQGTTFAGVRSWQQKFETANPGAGAVAVGGNTFLDVCYQAPDNNCIAADILPGCNNNVWFGSRVETVNHTTMPWKIANGSQGNFLLGMTNADLSWLDQGANNGWFDNTANVWKWVSRALEFWGSVRHRGGLLTTGLGAPSGLAVTQVGTAGTTAYTYVVTGVTSAGETVGSTAVQTTTGNAVLDATNSNVLNWSPMIGAATYNVYRTASAGTPSTTGRIATGVVASTYTDQGAAGNGSAVPTVDVSGRASLGGPLTLAAQALSAQGANTGDVWLETARNAVSVLAGSMIQQIATVLGTQTTAVTIANTTVETTTVGTLAGKISTQPANLYTVGKKLRIRRRGFITTTATPGTVQWRAKLGATPTVMLDTGAVTPPASLVNAAVEIDAEITCRTTGVGGTFSCQGKVRITSANAEWVAAIVNTGTIALDTTVANAYAETWAWATAAAGNSVTFADGEWELHN
jgi:hypothetical protein